MVFDETIFLKLSIDQTTLKRYEKRFLQWKDLTMALTKTDIVERIAAKNDCNPTEAKNVLEELLEIIKDTLASGENLMISGFGKFQVNEKRPRKGRNPATGDSMVLDKRRVVTFKISGKLRDRINIEINSKK